MSTSRDTIFSMQIIPLPPPSRSFLSVAVAVPLEQDHKSFTVKAQQALGGLNTYGEGRINRIKLICRPESNDFLDKAFGDTMEYIARSQRIPRAIVYFLSLKYFLENEAQLVAIADTAEDFSKLSVEERKKVARELIGKGEGNPHVPPPYIVIAKSSYDSSPRELALARHRFSVADGDSWVGRARARAEISPELLLPWVQRVIDIEAERQTA